MLVSSINEPLNIYGKVLSVQNLVSNPCNCNLMSLEQISKSMYQVSLVLFIELIREIEDKELAKHQVLLLT